MDFSLAHRLLIARMLTKVSQVQVVAQDGSSDLASVVGQELFNVGCLASVAKGSYCPKAFTS